MMEFDGFEKGDTGGDSGTSVSAGGVLALSLAAADGLLVHISSGAGSGGDMRLLISQGFTGLLRGFDESTSDDRARPQFSCISLVSLVGVGRRL